MTGAYEIGIASRQDVDAILALQEANQPERGGSLSARLSRGWLEQAISGMPIVVARRGNTIAGYLIAASPETYAGVPVVEAMLRAYPGRADAYVYGPVCVAAEARGGGLAGAMFGVLRTLLSGRQGVLFIRADNDASRSAHARMGMHERATFEFGGVSHVVLSYIG
ncbi:MAG TPA: hypothetical protein VET85_09535 [Stellaceae bacterium]|nr:hypothetical protein [Stellaceae bacterium]